MFKKQKQYQSSKLFLLSLLLLALPLAACSTLTDTASAAPTAPTLAAVAARTTGAVPNETPRLAAEPRQPAPSRSPPALITPLPPQQQPI